MADRFEALQRLADYIDREKQLPTTFDLCRGTDLADYYEVRRQLAGALDDELAERHSRDCWRWRITPKGRAYICAGSNR